MNYIPVNHILYMKVVVEVRGQWSGKVPPSALLCGWPHVLLSGLQGLSIATFFSLTVGSVPAPGTQKVSDCPSLQIMV